MDSTVMYINKGNALFARESKGTHTERKGNAVTRSKMLNIYYFRGQMWNFEANLSGKDIISRHTSKPERGLFIL